MKNKFGKRLAAVLLSVATVLGIGVAAGAASAQYDVTVEGKQLILSVNGRQTASYDMKDTDVKVTMDEDKDLLICYTNKKGKYIGLSLDGQRKLNIGGTMDHLTLGNPLAGLVSVAVPAGSDIDRLTVYSTGDVSIAGEVTYLAVNTAAKVVATGEAEIQSARLLSDKATLTAEEDAKVRRAAAVNRRGLKGSGIKDKATIDPNDTTEDGDYRVRFEVDGPWVLYVSRNDGLIELQDLDEDDLEMYVEAIGYDDTNDKHYLSGEFTWTDPHKVVYDPDDPGSDTITARFEFKPSKRDYESKVGSIKIDVIYR